MLVASVLYAFRLSDGGHIPPGTWYERVATHAGPTTVPDSLCTLPGAELLILGPVGAPPNDARAELRIRCGAVDRTLLIRRDQEKPEPTLILGPEQTVWHKEDNPKGRGGPNDERKPLIEDPDNPEHPVWLGCTPFDHPMRTRLAGKPEDPPKAGWPSGAQASILYEAHPKFWTETFQPAESIELSGPAMANVQCRLPPYRVALTSGHDDGHVRGEPVRIHTVALLPAAGIGAAIWRAPIAVRNDDMMGDQVVALIAALEDANAPATDPEHWARLAVERWNEPVKMIDDRPLLPPAMAKTVPAPFAMPDGKDPMAERYEATQAWAMDEMPFDKNPFEDQVPDATSLAEQSENASTDEDTGPDIDAMEIIAGNALAQARERHADAGFDDAPPPDVRLPTRRDHMLDAEVRTRLDEPYQSEMELGMRQSMTQVPDAQSMDPDETLAKLAKARILNPAPALPWDALEEDEAKTFGEAVAKRIDKQGLIYHVDISGAFIGEHGEEITQIEQHEFLGTLGEETTWRNTHFNQCTFKDSSFAKASFEECEFDGCSFEESNLCGADIVNSTFRDCSFKQLNVNQPTWYESRFERCSFESVSMTDLALSDLTFEDGRWHQVTWADAIAIRMVWRRMEFEETTFSQVHAPEALISATTMRKVSVMGLGFPHSTLEDIEATHCGFLSTARFDSTRLSRCRFAMTGFTNAVFSESIIESNVLFDNCDLSGAMFINAKMRGVRTLECGLAGSRWLGVDASEAWFQGARLRGVDFGDTELSCAVFADADIEGTIFMPDKTIGTDFRGTVRAAA